jgi:hypothetical protein
LALRLKSTSALFGSGMEQIGAGVLEHAFEIRKIVQVRGAGGQRPGLGQDLAKARKAHDSGVA